MQLPPWVPILVGALVISFGCYRIKLSFRSKPDEEAARRRGGLYGLPRRTQLLVGIVYVLLGGWLILSALGVKLVPGA